MKKVSVFLMILLMSVSLFAQDSTEGYKLFLRPYIENGINFIRNETLKELYSTQSMYHLGFGLQFGHPEFAKIIPFVQYSNSGFTIEQDTDQDVKTERTFEMDQTLIGGVFPIKKINKTYYNAKLAYCYSRIKESFYHINDNSHGILIGLSLEKILFSRSRIYIDFSYCFQKIEKAEFRDFDMIKLSAGFIF